MIIEMAALATISSFAVSFAGILLVYISATALYELFLSPLRRIPGPWYAALSEVWLLSHVFRLRQFRAVHELFLRYGPVVRIGPSKVAFCDATAAREVYTTYRFDKSSKYKAFKTNGGDHAFTTIEHASHSLIRKRYSAMYTIPHLCKFQPEMHDSARDLIEDPVDCLKLFGHLVTDVIVSVVFGHQLGALKTWRSGKAHSLVTSIDDFPKRGIARAMLSTWAWEIISRIPITRWRRICESDGEIGTFIRKRLRDMQKHKLGEGEVKQDKFTLLERLSGHPRSSVHELMAESAIISELQGNLQVFSHIRHIVAGVDTTANMLSYICWELSRRPDVAENLRSEIDTAMPDLNVVPDYSVLQVLPYLDAFIKESLRVHGSAPSLLERVVPHSIPGNSKATGYSLLDFRLPGGTVVGTQSWSMHRDAGLFPAPDDFVPSRWLTAPPEKTARMTRQLMPFGMGSRACAGQNMAQMVMRITVAVLVRSFHISAPPETNEASMYTMDTFTAFPASMECKLIFRPRGN
ncbi:cytochrome P450 [Fistulina hepatica ATCC 64428]|uniref:Cytochrome P450 n=1 Tax=Fistulina hepatica ATCC 64428 TaxID=1128425 RepID=A0A0D7AAQ1_9AGAR|nr:cytochrome P450 [Fistulina hepatica ATCC 64428]